MQPLGPLLPGQGHDGTAGLRLEAEEEFGWDGVGIRCTLTFSSSATTKMS